MMLSYYNGNDGLLFFSLTFSCGYLQGEFGHESQGTKAVRHCAYHTGIADRDNRALFPRANPY